MKAASRHWGGGVSECDSLRGVSLIVSGLWVVGCELNWFSKLGVLGVHLSSVCLKSCSARCGVLNPLFSEALGIGDPSQLWVAMVGVGFMTRL